MNKEYSLRLSAPPDPSGVQVVREGLNAYNATQGGGVEYIWFRRESRHCIGNHAVLTG